MRLPSSLSLARSLCWYSFTTSHPSSEESAIRLCLFLWNSFFSSFFNSLSDFSTCGVAACSREVEAYWTCSTTTELRENYFSLPSKWTAEYWRCMADMSLFSAASCSGDRDNRRIFLSKNFESGIFFDTKIWQAFFGWLDLSTDFFGYSKQSEGSL